MATKSYSYEAGTESETLNNNKKTMNIFEKLELEEFAKSGDVKIIATQMKEARGTQETFRNVARKIDDLSRTVGGTVDLLDCYANSEDIASLKEVSAELVVLMDVLADKKVTSAIASLSKVLKVNEEETGATDEKEMAVSLGL